MIQPSLPIQNIITSLLKSLEQCPRAIVTADPGSGKSTELPLCFVEGHLKTIVAQPRRVSARSLAQFVAQKIAEPVGQRVGYRVRNDVCVSEETRLEYVTDGVLLRLIQGDPELTDIDVVILDEFHERSVNLDLCLAFLMEIQQAFRPDLKIIIMSATLDVTSISAWSCAPHFHAAGRIFPLDIRRLAAPISFDGLISGVTRHVLEALSEQNTGNILVFLPSTALIFKVERALQARTSAAINPLYGRLPLEQQSKILSYPQRQVILATNVAETSLTIPRVNRVIDSGWRRQARYVHQWAADALFETRITKFSATQRAGRANRTGPGVVTQLWTEHEYLGMPISDAPAIRTDNLENLYVECLRWGSPPEAIRWLSAPPVTSMQHARETLEQLGVITNEGSSQKLSHNGSSPLGHRSQLVVLDAQHLAETDKTVLAYLLPILEGEKLPGQKLASLLEFEGHRSQSGYSKAVSRLQEELSVASTFTPRRLTLTEPVLKVLLKGYPERLGQRRQLNSFTYTMANGCGGKIHPKHEGRLPEYIFALSVGGSKQAELTIFDFLPCESEWLPAKTERIVLFSEAESKVVARTRRQFQNLIISEQPEPLPKDNYLIATILSQALIESDTPVLTLSKEYEELIARVNLVRQAIPSIALPLPLGAAPISEHAETLLELCLGHRSFADVKKVNLVDFYLQSLNYAQRKTLDQGAPEILVLSNGQRVKVTYSDTLGPIISTRFEWLFGLNETPRILGAPVLLELLAPNLRPVQRTQDLAGFWTRTYPQVRKDLRGRYPKHPWPEDPLSAMPGLRRAKPSK